MRAAWSHGHTNRNINLDELKTIRNAIYEILLQIESSNEKHNKDWVYTADISVQEENLNKHRSRAHLVYELLQDKESINERENCCKKVLQQLLAEIKTAAKPYSIS